jgi:hypothetical protein
MHQANGRAADPPEQGDRRRLPRSRSDVTNVSPLALAVGRHAGRGGQASVTSHKGNARLKKLVAEVDLEKAMRKDLAEENFLARSADGGPLIFYRSVTGHLCGGSAGS